MSRGRCEVDFTKLDDDARNLILNLAAMITQHCAIPDHQCMDTVGFDDLSDENIARVEAEVKRYFNI